MGGWCGCCCWWWLWVLLLRVLRLHLLLLLLLLCCWQWWLMISMWWQWRFGLYYAMWCVQQREGSQGAIQDQQDVRVGNHEDLLSLGESELEGKKLLVINICSRHTLMRVWPQGWIGLDRRIPLKCTPLFCTPLEFLLCHLLEVQFDIVQFDEYKSNLSVTIIKSNTQSFNHHLFNILLFLNQVIALSLHCARSFAR